MPNLLSVAGLETATQAEMLAAYSASMQIIYGQDINLDPDSPDGQFLNIFIQTALDMLDVLVQIYNQIDPDNAIGSVLDQRVAVNGIQRQAGTYTITNITLVISQALNLYGLDQTANPVFTVADGAGNQWQLIVSQVVSSANTYIYAFQAALPGAVLTTPNTITNPVTVVLGITSINNPTTYTTLGIDEESDAALKIRRQQSVSLASSGYYNGLLAALENINGVTSAFVIENTTGLTVNNVPGHSIWVIVGGSGAAASIAQAIYSKRSTGCGMYNSGDGGAQSYSITQADGSNFIVYWDDVVTVTPFIKFTATAINSATPPQIKTIIAYLVANYTPGVNAEVNINQLATLVQLADPNTLVTNAGFCLTESGGYTNTLTPAAFNNQFSFIQTNIVITPMIMAPTTITLAPLATATFTAFGGYGAITYSISVNNSGGSINGSSGVYTAGSTPNVTDTILATDTVSNTATASAVVT